MQVSYHIDFNDFSLNDYVEYLSLTKLPPSRRILQENTILNFRLLQKVGINTLAETLKAFNTKDKMKAFTDLSEEYLIILCRDIRSLQPKPVRLIDIPGLNQISLRKLESLGIKNTKAIFPYILDPASREMLHQESDIPSDEILEFAKLTDIARIKWVGALFARMLVDIGCDSVKKARMIDPLVLHKQINDINEERTYFNGRIGLNDMKIFVEAARIVPLSISLDY